MVPRASIQFIEVNYPIQELVTKFGGQPVWLEAPQWPVSRTTGEPMRFIGQVALGTDIFGPIDGRMCYLFMTFGGEFVHDTNEPDGGENAVIVQLGEPVVPVKNLREGPSLYRMVHHEGQQFLTPEACEFAVELTTEEDPDYVSEDKREDWPDERHQEYDDSLLGNKIGGTPGFIQGDEFPGGDFSMLILQLDSTEVPFFLNFGDCGVGYAFLSSNGRSGKFLWQC